MTEPQNATPTPNPGNGADGAQVLTPEQARLIIEAARAGVTPEQIASAHARLAQAAAPPPEPAPPALPDFVHINPRTPVFCARKHGDVIQGYVLVSQFDPVCKEALFVLSLTEPCAYTLPGPTAVGEHVVVWSSDQLSPLAHLIARWGNDGTCESAYEVRLERVIDEHAHEDEDVFAILARRIESPVVKAPAFAVQPLIAPDGP